MTSFAAECAPGTTPGKIQIASKQPADEDLIIDIRRRDEAAFAQLLSRHLDAVHRYIYRLTGSHHDADELAQETFLRVWQKAGSYKASHGKVSTWLYRIAHNLCIDEFRRTSSDAKATPDAAAIEALPDTTADQESLLAQNEQLLALQEALNALPLTQRSALLLCQVQGFSNLEAAKILNIGRRALESLLARARRNLRNNENLIKLMSQI